jgi:hypothetical protein
MNPQQESQALMDAIRPLADEMLRRCGEFYPYGGYMKQDGSIVEVGVADPDTDHPQSKDLLYVLRTSLKDLARRNQCKAVAVVFDVTVTLPHSDRQSDAIQVCVEHSDHYSVEVFFPYHFSENELIYGETFVQQGENEIFAES